uniref:Uncharacterized protein n=1 Tax=Chrysemys picta bellii TaxID=8478 RepID=A0A8C3FUY7_CHRPI
LFICVNFPFLIFGALSCVGTYYPPLRVAIFHSLNIYYNRNLMLHMCNPNEIMYVTENRNWPIFCKYNMNYYGNYY